MSEIDDKLEIIAQDSYLIKNDLTERYLAAALLRARKVLRLISAENEMLDYSAAAQEALNDKELEEALK